MLKEQLKEEDVFGYLKKQKLEEISADDLLKELHKVGIIDFKPYTRPFKNHMESICSKLLECQERDWDMLISIKTSNRYIATRSTTRSMKKVSDD